MSEAHEHKEQATPEAEAHTTLERDNTRTTFIFVLVLGTCMVLGGLVVAVDQFFGLQVQDEIARKLLRPESTPLRKLRAEEEAKLTSYRWVDKASGVVQIPVERAMELVRAEWKSRPAAYVPGAAAQAAAAPAPESKAAAAKAGDAKPADGPGGAAPRPKPAPANAEPARK